MFSKASKNEVAAESLKPELFIFSILTGDLRIFSLILEAVTTTSERFVIESEFVLLKMVCADVDIKIVKKKKLIEI